ncbi:MAG TPA: DbpA RNA binding domain-containing protein [Gemmatimonadales bacterium]|nr:DbpA RNA binding domain-containing protein [Gemmatimonadales bacterium]
MSDPNAQSTLARGHNLVVLAPPAPVSTSFVLAGVMDRLGAEGSTFLALAPDEAIPEWARVAEQLRGGRPIRIAGAQTPARLTGLLRSGEASLFVSSPASALELVRRATLKMERLTGLLVLWPEAWGESRNDLLAALFQDLPRETQRVIVTTDPKAGAEVIEHHGWRAPVSDHLGALPPGPAPPVRTTPVAWERRIAVLGPLIEELDPSSLAVWTAAPLDHGAIEHGLAAAGAPAIITTQTPPPASLIIAYDLPAPGMLRELAGAGEVLLLVPPGTESYVARLASIRRPVHPRGVLSRAREEADRDRRTIADRLDRGPGTGSLVSLAPLFERYEATAVAAVLFELWQEARSQPGFPASAAPSSESRQRLWVAIGKRDGVTPNDLVGMLTRECKVPKEAIGRIEIRETFSLVEIAESANPGQVVEQLAGKTIRKRRLAAKVDRKDGQRGGGAEGQRGAR